MKIPKSHPRALSLEIRDKVIQGMHMGVVAEAGLIAHGRGEAFDYLIGEKTLKFALQQEKVAIALMLLAEKPVISVNGNLAALCSKEIVKLSEILKAPLEVNLFYRREERAHLVAKKLKKAGAKNILGMEKKYHTIIEELKHSRRVVDKRGIFAADVVFVPLEDGDRTMALRKLGKKVITIDLNPLSRTSIWSNVTIVNNLIRAIPEMVDIAEKQIKWEKVALKELINNFDNYTSLTNTLSFIQKRINILAEGKLEKVEI